MHTQNPLLQYSKSEDPIITPFNWPVIMELEPYTRQVGRIAFQADSGYQPFNCKDEPLGVPVPTFYEARKAVLDGVDPEYLPWELSNSFEENENDQEPNMEEKSSRFLLKKSCVLEGSIYNVYIDNQDWLLGLDDDELSETETAVTNLNMETNKTQKGADNKSAKQEKDKPKSPTLTCIVTGKTRNTTEQYLTEKAARLGCDVATLHRRYVCKDVTKLYNAGKNQEEIRAALNVPDSHNPISEKLFKESMKYNGKRKAEKAEAATPAKSNGKKNSSPAADQEPTATAEPTEAQQEEPATAEQAA